MITGRLSAEIISIHDEQWILSSIDDITERKRAEEDLRASEERYQHFIAHSFEAISRTEFDELVDITLPVETQIDLIYENAYMAECNQAMADMYHLPSPQAFAGVRLIDAHGGKDSPVNRAAFRKLIENGYKSINDETIEYTANGQPVWFLSNTIGVVENGRLVRLWGTAIDITDRKEAENNVERARKLLASTLDALPVGVCLTDESGYYRLMNDAYCAIYEYEREEMLGQHYRVIMPPDQVALANAHYARLLSGDVGIPVERKRQCKDGRIVYIEVANTLVESVDGQKMVITTVRDITERKQAEEEIKQLAKFPAENPYPVLRVMREGAILYANDASTPLLHAWGCRAGDALPARWRELAQAALASGANQLAEAQTGERVFSLTFAPVVEAGYVNVYGLDITARKQTEEALIRRVREFAALYEISSEIARQTELPELLNTVTACVASLLGVTGGGIYLYDEERNELQVVASLHSTIPIGAILQMGEGMAGRVAQSRQPMIVNDYRNWKYRASQYSAVPFTAVVEAPMLYRGALIGVLAAYELEKDTRQFTEEDAQLLSLLSGRIAGVVHNARNITARQQAESERKAALEALRELNNQLEQRIEERTRELAEANLRLAELGRLKDDFITRISHELRTPLTNIKLYLRLLEQGQPEKHEAYLHTLRQQAERLQDLIEDLLNISHLTLDAIEVRAAPLDVSDLLHGLMTDHAARALERGLTLTAVPAPARPILTTDRNLLRQALGHVLTNALHYTLRGGAITARTDQTITSEGAWVTIEVPDTGPGISAEDLPRIFEPFYRGTAAADYKTPGTGVGLSIAQRLVERLGGASPWNRVQGRARPSPSGCPPRPIDDW